MMKNLIKFAVALVLLFTMTNASVAQDVANATTNNDNSIFFITK